MSGLLLHLVECFFAILAHEPCCPKFIVVAGFFAV